MSRYFSTPTSEAGYKIRTFLHQINFPHKIVESAWKSNKQIFIPFLKEKNIKYYTMNQRYKGINTSELKNCYTILESKELWDEFRAWCKVHELRQLTVNQTTLA